ncbi:glycosyltransferase family 4 protein [Runella slithyformis]|nr:glycosyltransferase family 4 protein [Runella slithyformis]
MNVLLATWTWYPIGGDWTYVENIKRLYESNGINVIPFSTINKNNVPSEYDHYFVNAYNYKELNRNKNIMSGLKALKNSIVSIEALYNIDKLLDENEIAFAHLHIIHHWVTPGIIWKLKKRNIPIIWTLHEYKLLCPEGTFVSNEKICEKCINGKFYNCALNKCKKQSFLASTLTALDAYFYNYSRVYEKVDLFLCPSNFLLNKFKEFGFSPHKLILTNYCYDINSIDLYYNNNINRLVNSNFIEKDRYILYVGRIEKLKGIKTLLDAINGTDIKLKIAGTGAALNEMVEYSQNNKIYNVTFLGFQQKDIVYDLTINSVCVVCPSEWYENYPFSVIESLLLSKPVVGSDIGGIPELVIDGETGFLHKPGDILGLRNALLKIWSNPILEKKLGMQARSFAQSKVSFQVHWNMLKNVLSKIKISI